MIQSIGKRIFFATFADMDIVITYVDGKDPVWLEQYSNFTNTPILEKRFRDWGTLRYLFRGIEVNMPFIDNVFLVVAGKSQIPGWINQEQVKVVLHEDFVPHEFLPTFNCNPLEMYLHRIKGLNEQYLYFNDDMFPMLPCSPEDFYREDKSVIGFYSHLITGSNMYKQICRNSDRLARKASGKGASLKFVRPQHICSPMQKSLCEEVFRAEEDSIRNSISRVRTNANLNQYLYLDYMLFKGKVINERISNKHISVAMASAESIAGFIDNPTRKLVCINDVHLDEKRYGTMRAAILNAFEKRFPEKSRFEL